MLHFLFASSSKHLQISSITVSRSPSSSAAWPPLPATLLRAEPNSHFRGRDIRYSSSQILSRGFLPRFLAGTRGIASITEILHGTSKYSSPLFVFLAKRCSCRSSSSTHSVPWLFDAKELASLFSVAVVAVVVHTYSNVTLELDCVRSVYQSRLRSTLFPQYVLYVMQNL